MTPDLGGVRDMVAGDGHPRERMARQFLESEAFNSILTVLTYRERAIVGNVVAIMDAHGIEHDIEVPDPADRMEQIKGFLTAKINEQGREWYVKTVLPELIGLENAEDAAEYARVSPEEWEQQKQAWIDALREEGIEDASDAELVRAHVRTEFGIDLDKFESLIVEWPDRGDGEPSRDQLLVQEILAGGFIRAERGLAKIADEVGADLDRDPPEQHDGGETDR